MTALPILAEPVVYGNFRFNGSEFQTISGTDYFPRPTIPDLLVLLEWTAAPVYTAKGQLAKRQPTNEDRSAAFYTSACLHYGLQPYKTKDKAKDCLLEVGSCFICIDAIHLLHVY